MSGYEWLAKAKKGDPVIVYGGLGSEASVGVIVRTTATRIMVRGGSYQGETAFHRKNARQVGGRGWSSIGIAEGTPEAVKAVTDEVRQRKLAGELNHRNWRNLPLETLERVTALLTESVAEKPNV